MPGPIEFERIDTHGWSPDGDLENADWIKQSWQLPRELDEFLDYLDVRDKPAGIQGGAVAMFMQLPVARNMPASLREELIAAGLIDR